MFQTPDQVLYFSSANFGRSKFERRLVREGAVRYREPGTHLCQIAFEWLECESDEAGSRRHGMPGDREPDGAARTLRRRAPGELANGAERSRRPAGLNTCQPPKHCGTTTLSVSAVSNESRNGHSPFKRVPAPGGGLVKCSRMLAVALSLSALAPFPLTAQSSLPRQPTVRAEVLVVGVYHMSNPGRDVFSTETDDVLSPKRQAEIAQVAAVLGQFRPTKIAVEAGFSDSSISQRYADYVGGTYELTRNEVDQLGFRVARELGHGTVHAVDVRGEFPYPRLAKYAQATGQTPAFDALERETGEAVDALSTYIATHTVLEALLHMNADEQVAEAVGSYFRLAEFGEPWDWAGADLVSDWFRRNMRIYNNIVRLVDSPDERILVIYGAGHLGWLQYALGSNPSIRLRKLAEYVR